MKNQHELISFYNLENLFLPDFFGDKEQSGLKNWTKKRYENKLHKIASVFELIQKTEKKLPILAGVCEIENDRVLRDLVGQKVFQGQYDFVHFDSMDERGIDVALLYDTNKIEVLYAEPFTYFFEIEDDNPDNYDTTRDVLYCRVRYENEVLNLFIVHLPSKRENDINAPKRGFILNKIKEKTTEMIQNQNEAVIILGDFNENPNEPNIQSLMDGHLFFNPFLDLFKNRKYTTFYKRFGLTFDQIIYSINLRNHRFEFQEAQIFNHDEIRNYDKRFKGRPFRTYVGTRYLGGYSDHFPIYIRLKVI
ncbi:MAG: endonuclease [Flavobacteriales bacterium]|nr:MAG: endonuclease [Flavobacteriales bacterium]